MGKLAIVYQDAAALKPRPNNPRTHSNAQLKQIVDSIRTFGFTNAVLVDAGRKTFSYLYDFGDGWSHTVKLEKILPLDMSLDGPKIIAKKGKAPKQYRYDDW